MNFNYNKNIYPFYCYKKKQLVSFFNNNVEKVTGAPKKVECIAGAHKGNNAPHKSVLYVIIRIGAYIVIAYHILYNFFKQ